MKRAAIYARYSSDRQNEKSCQDQINLCKSWAERQGFQVEVVYQDQAISGASVVNRDGLASLMLDANEGKFDIVICEALDRLSRDQADLAQIKKQLNFLDISIHTVQDGEIGSIHVGIKGLMGELYLADLAQKTSRGLRAVVNDGRQAGGKSYGYNIVAGKPGELTINEDEAEVIRRIFTEYAADNSPRVIAAGLNEDAIPSPRGGKWNSSTINGSRARQNGILQNLLYDGKTVWNRQRFIKDPSTGKRVSRVNPKEKWVTHEAPGLRIVDEELFKKVALIKKSKTFGPAHKARKPKYIFTGLLKCGCCGASYTIIRGDRLGCAGRRERGDCDNNRTISRHLVEERVLSALSEKLAKPEYIAIYVKEYYEERKRLQKTERSSIKTKQTKLKKLTADIERGVTMLLNGTMPESMGQKIKKMETEKKVLETEINSLVKDTTPIRLHPALADKYYRAVKKLHEHLNNLEDDTSKNELFTLVRELVEKVVIQPQEEKGVELEVYGQLAGMLNINQEEKGRLSVVAGARNNQYPTLRFSA